MATNALSALADGNPALAESLDDVKNIYLPVIVLGEYRYGISKSKYRKNYEYWLNEIVADIAILPIIDATTEYYAFICRRLKNSGTPIPTNDIWIAALALEHQLPVITNDQHFKNVDNLKILTY